MSKWYLLFAPLLVISGLALAADDAVIAEVYGHIVTHNVTIQHAITAGLSRPVL